MEKIYGESLKEIALAIISVYGFTELPAKGQIAKILECRCDLSNLLLCAMREADLGYQLSVSLANMLRFHSTAEMTIDALKGVARATEGMIIDIAPTVLDYIDKELFPEDFECEKEAA